MKVEFMVSSDIQNRALEYFLRFWVLSGVPLALIGNAASDIWLSVTGVLFLFYTIFQKQWFWLKIRWFQIAILFWVWMLATSALSFLAENSLPESAAWIRFPVFALALPFFLGLYQGLFRQFCWVIVMGLLFLVAVLVLEKINNPDAVRLFGTWNQHTKIGWFVVGFGLPVSYWLLSKLFEENKHALWVIPLVSLFMLAVILTGEIYATLSFLFGLGLFVLVNRLNMKMIAGMAGIVLTATFGMFYLLPELSNRFYHSLTTRLPWMPGSDYYTPWMRGLKVAELNPLTGIGVKNYEAYCQKTADVLAVGKGGACLPHPHQLYIQVWAETGIIGFILFVAMIVFMFWHIVRNKKRLCLSLPVLSALCLLITVLWPISTYSHAFGQHKNFFTWFGIAWALYLAHPVIPQLQGQKRQTETGY